MEQKIKIMYHDYFSVSQHIINSQLNRVCYTILSEIMHTLQSFNLSEFIKFLNFNLTKFYRKIYSCIRIYNSICLKKILKCEVCIRRVNNEIDLKLKHSEICRHTLSSSSFDYISTNYSYVFELLFFSPDLQSSMLVQALDSCNASFYRYPKVSMLCHRFPVFNYKWDLI